MATKRVILSDLDGFQFEVVCAEIFSGLGYSVTNSQHVGDEGRDLILTDPDGVITVAECKHWPEGTVGRPVIQKLQSAVDTWPNAQKGMVLTTGTFSRQAYGYLGKVKIPIDLIDLERLRSLAARAGIDLVSNSSSIPVSAYAISDAVDLSSTIDRGLYSNLESAPSKPSSLIDIVDRIINLRPALVVKFSLQQEFSTSVGLLHEIDIVDETLMLDGHTGEIFESPLADFFESVRYVPLTEAIQDQSTRQDHDFAITRDALLGRAVSHIIYENSMTVNYRGRNNQSYSKECIPSAKNILFTDSRQIYVPEQKVVLKVFDRKYPLSFVEDGHQIQWHNSPSITNCSICNKDFEQGLLCNACGAVSHPPTFFWPHGFRCKTCAKTICKQCAFFRRKKKFFKAILCEECAEVDANATQPLIR